MARLNRESNPTPGEKPGFMPQHEATDGTMRNTGENNPLPVNGNVQLTGSIVEKNILKNPKSFGEAKAVDLSSHWTDTRPHHSFGSISTGKNGEVFLLYRSGFHHGVDSQNIGGDIMISEYDEPNDKWSDPQLLIAADTNRDLRDITLTFDEITNLYYLVYADADINYGTDHKLVILRGSDPYNLTEDVSPATPPFDEVNQTFHHIIRNGSYMYLPIYGRSATMTDYAVAILRAGGNGQTWTTLTVLEENAHNEMGMYFTINPETKTQRMNLIIRGSEGYHRYSDDYGVTWSEPKSISFNADGGPQVFDMNGYYMLVARDQRKGNEHNYIYAAYSLDGVEWHGRERIGDVGPSYASVATTPSGKMLICYFEEWGYDSRIMIREVKRKNVYELIEHEMNQKKLHVIQEPPTQTVTAGTTLEVDFDTTKYSSFVVHVVSSGTHQNNVKYRPLKSDGTYGSSSNAYLEEVLVSSTVASRFSKDIRVISPKARVIYTNESTSDMSVTLYVYGKTN